MKGGVSWSNNGILVAWRLGAVFMEQCQYAVPAIAASGCGFMAGMYVTSKLATDNATTSIIGSAGVVVASSFAAFVAAGLSAYSIALMVDFWRTRQKIQNLLNKYELEWDSDLETITKTFRKFWLIHHPDRGGDEAKFVECREDYESIRAEAEKRAEASILGTLSYSLSINIVRILQEIIPMFAQTFAEGEMQLERLLEMGRGAHHHVSQPHSDTASKQKQS